MFQVWKTKAQERLAREEKEREFQRLEAHAGGKQTAWILLEPERYQKIRISMNSNGSIVYT